MTFKIIKIRMTLIVLLNNKVSFIFLNQHKFLKYFLKLINLEIISNFYRGNKQNLKY